MPKGKCVFNQKWLENCEYSGWLKEDANKHSAKCSLCSKTFDISNMGEAAVRSHKDGAKHKKYASIRLSNTLKSTMDDFIQRPERSEPLTSNSEANSNAMNKETIGAFCTGNECLRSEVLWTLKVVKSHYSFCSCKDVQKLFSEMFPDSEIAKQFSCGEKKCAYLCNFGIAPYFKQLLKDTLHNQQSYVLLFDESLNKKTYNKQMDIHCRLWGDDAQVGT